MDAEARGTVHVHHEAARCLLALFDAAAEGLAPWAEYDAEAERWGVDPRLNREDLEAVVEGSARELPAADHRRLHRDAGDFVRWGRRGGLRTLALYGLPAVLRAPGPPALGPRRARGAGGVPGGPPMRAATQTLAQLRAAREWARTEYLAAARTVPRDTEERGRRWREFGEANAAYLQARGDTR